MNIQVSITRLLFFIALSTCYTTLSLLRSPALSKKAVRKQYYTYAGIVPVLHDNDGTYIVLCKLRSSSRHKALYGDFGSTPLKQDGNNPLITAARSFSDQTGICYEALFDVIKKQCTQDSCVLKSNTGRILLYPLEFKAHELPLFTNKYNNKHYACIALRQLQQALERRKQPVILKSKQGVLCTLDSTVVQAMLHNRDTTKNTQVKNIFERFN
jgi:hypothetical protein